MLKYGLKQQRCSSWESLAGTQEHGCTVYNKITAQIEPAACCQTQQDCLVKANNPSRMTSLPLPPKEMTSFINRKARMGDRSLQTNFNSCLEIPVRYQRQPGCDTQCSGLGTRQGLGTAGTQRARRAFPTKMIIFGKGFGIKARSGEPQRSLPILSRQFSPMCHYFNKVVSQKNEGVK